MLRMLASFVFVTVLNQVNAGCDNGSPRDKLQLHTLIKEVSDVCEHACVRFLVQDGEKMLETD